MFSKWETAASRTVRFSSDDFESIMELCLCRPCGSNQTHWLQKYPLSSTPVLNGNPSSVDKILWYRVMSNNVKDDAPMCENNEIAAIVRFALMEKITTLFTEARDTWGKSDECMLKILRDKMVDLSKSREHGDDIQVKLFELSA